MNWKNLFKRSRSPESSGALSWLAELMPTRAGASVNSAESAMTIAAVYRCVDILSGTIASLELDHQRRSGEIFSTRDDSDLGLILAGQANERQTFFVLMRSAIIRMLLHGNAYILPRYNARGDRLESLIPLDSASVYYDVYKNNYTISDPIWGVSGTFEADEIIHLRNKSLDGGYTGVSTIQYASESLSLSLNADRQTNQGIMSGNQKSGFLTGGDSARGLGALNDDVADKVTERINRQIQEGNRIIRVPASMSFLESSMSNSDVELLEIRKYTVLDVCRFFGVHPYMVFADQSTNYKEAENSQINFLNQTLRPILRQIETEFTTKLIGRNAQRRERIKYDIKGLLSLSLTSQADYIRQCVESGTMTPNEGRAMEGRAPLEGGDQLFISCNVASINSDKIQGEKIPTEPTNDKNNGEGNKELE